MNFYDLISSPTSPASPASLEAVERTGEVPLPRPLRDLLATTNGGDLKESAVLRIPDGSTAGGIYILRAEELAKATATLLGTERSLVVWARDGSGNALVMDRNGQIYFWDHDTDILHDFGCGLDKIAHFFQERAPRPPETSRAGEPTAAGLKELLAADAPLDHVKRLIDESLDATTVERYLIAAINADREDVVRLVLSAGRPSEEQLRKPLSVASARGLTDAIRDIVAAGADVNARLHGGTTALMSAASAGKLGAVKLLVELGADPTLTQVQGWTAERIAIITQRADVAAFLKSLT